MKTRFTKTTAIVAAAHILFVAGIYLIGTGFSSVRHNAIQSASSVSESFVAFEYQPSTPSAEEPSHVTETVIPVAAAASPSRIHTVRTQRSSATRSTNSITRMQSHQIRRPPSAEQILQDMLNSDPGSGGAANAAGDKDLATVRDAYHRAWLPPAKDVAGNASATALIVFELDGRIKEARIIQPSGNQSLDTSVSLVLQQVSEISGLTDSILRKKEGVTILFEVVQ